MKKYEKQILDVIEQADYESDWVATQVASIVLARVRNYMLDVIGDNEDEELQMIEGIVTLKTIPNVRNQLRDEQRKRAEELL